MCVFRVYLQKSRLYIVVLGHQGVQALPTYIVNSWRPDEDVMPSKVNGCVETGACRCSGDSKPHIQELPDECTKTGLWLGLCAVGVLL